MKRRYCVIFVNLLQKKEVFISTMSELGVDPDTAARILQKAPVILKADLSYEQARRYAGAVIKAGGKVRIKEDKNSQTRQTGPSMKIMAFENFVMCPRCGYKQLREPSCKRCGFHFNEDKKGRKW